MKVSLVKLSTLGNVHFALIMEKKTYCSFYTEAYKIYVHVFELKVCEVEVKNMSSTATLSPDWVFIDGIIKQQDVETEDSHQQCVKR